MRPLSEKISSIPPSATIEITDRARRMKTEGIDVISLSIGEPDFETPKHITDACINALREGKTHYEASQGTPELREAISEKLRNDNGVDVDVPGIVVACGAKNNIYEAMEACLNPGDEVIIIDPSWVSYEPTVRIAGGTPVHHSLNGKDFQIDDSLFEKITEKTKMIVLNTPSNPTGSVLSKESLSIIADICRDNDIIALSDEIYEKLIYDKEHLSIGAMNDMAERTITINGFSKAYAMTGWRIGYAAASPEIAMAMTKVQQHTISHPTTFAMWGALAALKGDQSCIEDMRVEFDRRRRYVCGELESMGFKTAPADGAFYAFVNIDGDDMERGEKWLEEAHVAVTPGTAFNAPGWIRISYAAKMDTLKEAMRRIREFEDRRD